MGSGAVVRGTLSPDGSSLVQGQRPWPNFPTLSLAIVARGSSVGQATDMRIRAVPGLQMPAIGGRGTKILQDENPYRAGTAALAGAGFDSLDQVAQLDIFAQADVAQGVPDFGLQPHTRPTATRGDIAIDE